MSAAKSANVTSEAPHQVCKEMFVHRSHLTTTVIYLSVVIIGLALGAIAFGYDGRERISINEEKIAQHEKVLTHIETIDSKLDILIRRDLPR